jgi:hypothetical protein
MSVLLIRYTPKRESYRSYNAEKCRDKYTCIDDALFRSSARK